MENLHGKFESKAMFFFLHYFSRFKELPVLYVVFDSFVWYIISNNEQHDIKAVHIQIEISGLLCSNKYPFTGIMIF